MTKTIKKHKILEQPPISMVTINNSLNILPLSFFSTFTLLRILLRSWSSACH